MQQRPGFLLLLLLMMTGLPAMGQQKELKIRNNEIGVFADASLGNEDQRTNLFGLQYRHFKTDKYHNAKLGYRVVAGVGTARQDGSGVYFSTGSVDSIKRVTKDVRLDMYFVGGGLDAQHRVFRSLWIYAAATATVGYGKTSLDSTTEFLRRNPLGNYGNYAGESPAAKNKLDLGNSFWVGLAPVVGVKMEVGKRLWIGLEISTLLTIDNQPYNTSGGRLTNVNLYPGRFNNRAFVSCRF